MTRPRKIERNLNLTVEIYVAANQNTDNTIDKICDEIESEIYNDVTIAGNAKDVIVSTVDVDFDGDGEVPVARATMNLTIIYLNEEGNQSVPK